uniref:Reverse transcriptase domain-containing protein n=1 Tax=Anolis carolinensis TaxID=28377 RepID=A0A803T6E7_ANOCA
MDYSRQALRNKDNNTAVILASMKVSYKALIKQKKDIYAKEQWKQLALAVTQKNEKQFWDITSRGMHMARPVILGHISSEQWFTHFSGLYGANSSENNPPTIFEMTCLPLWLPVIIAEIKKLIAALALGKAPGENMMPPEIFKNFPEWWAPILAKVFTQINNSGLIPEGWKQSIVVPIYKKGDKQDPNNYRPISLLDIDSKLYSKHLLNKLEDWESANHIIHPEQAGFRKGQSTIDQCLTLYFLAQQAITGPTKHLFVAFVDLAATFDSIDRNLLWQKLTNTNIDKCLLFLIKALYSDTTARIRVGTSGSLTDAIHTSKGVKQGCLLAPTLFILE